MGRLPCSPPWKSCKDGLSDSATNVIDTGTAQVPAASGARIPRRDEIALGDGQLWHPQTSPSAGLVEAPSSFCSALCPDQFQLAESGRAVVWPLDEQENSPRLVRQRGRSANSDRGILGGLERGPETLPVDCHSGIHRRETFALSSNPGENPARLHDATKEKGKEIVVQLFSGHYTSTNQGARIGVLRFLQTACSRARSEPRPVRELLRELLQVGTRIAIDTN